MLETASFSNIVNLRMDFNLSRSPNPILQTESVDERRMNHIFFCLTRVELENLDVVWSVRNDAGGL